MEPDSIKVISLDHGKANALDLELVARLESELQAAQASSSIRAVILTASGHIFSAGLDLFRLLRDGEDYVRTFLPIACDFFRRLFIFPKPVIAAINGHAIAGGCVIALACDYRLMASGDGLIGLTELRVSVPFPPIAFEIVRFAVPPQHLQEVVYRAATYRSAEALAKGLIDEVTAADALSTRAMVVAKELAQIPPRVFSATKERMRGEAAARTPDLDENTLKAWMDPATHEKISAYLFATLGRSV